MAKVLDGIDRGHESASAEAVTRARGTLRIVVGHLCIGVTEPEERVLT
jgi:hypothetical protein